MVLGLVTCHVGEVGLDHEGFTHAIAVRQSTAAAPKYSGFADEPLDGLGCLAADLMVFTTDFDTQEIAVSA